MEYVFLEVLTPSLIAAHASDNQFGLRAFTLFAPDDQKNNEIGLASEIADNFGLIHEGLPVDVSDGISSALDMMYCYQEPFLAFPQTIYFREIGNIGTKVVLNGLGGDELFGGYRYYSWIKYWKILKNFSFLFPNTLEN